ncbi:glucose 1-dehydrogenase [Streptosporangium oxazolinicum]|uniref:Glucose 1-dehydrogenase n=1 Tax=Streptosporangium oxazolinicum TaxID=909287 RepID=A0ABP8BN95_9ACTN
MTISVNELFSVTGRTAVVTGASSGLGHRFCRVLHAAGANVVAAARRQDRIDELAKDLGGDRVLAVRCDVADEWERGRLVDEALRRFGAIDILVNNAGISSGGPAAGETLAGWQRVIDVNLTSVFALSRLAAGHMLKAGRGSIVNVASIYGLVAAAPMSQASYSASKGGVVNLTRDLACQWSQGGVRVNALAPGWFPSELTHGVLTREDRRGADYIRRNTPMSRFGEEHELDGALLFLASDASSYVTGHTIAVDGGWTAH